MIPKPPAPEETEPETPAEGEGLPDEIIKIPAIQAVIAGSPPAVSMALKGSEDREERKLVEDHQEALQEAGMGFYRSLSGALGVMFNGLKIHPDDIVAADRAGKLTAIAPDFDKLNHEVAKSGRAHPVLSANRPVAALPMPLSAATPPQAASGALPMPSQTNVPPAPASVARRLAAQRVLNLQTGAPTSGPAPGAGRILNRVLTPAV